MAIEKINTSLKNPDAEDFWGDLMQVSAELMCAERSSLMIFDEKKGTFTVKAAIGVKADEIREQSENVGERVARLVLQEGKPVVVADINKIGLPAAPSDRRYKTGSFICYPFIIGDRKIGVLNVTDKADGTAYGEFELDLLNAIAPQVAILIDWATLRNKTGELEQLSITDQLTGLLNRRYLEERLAEEIKRSSRYGYPMSFLMIDVDDFGKINKDFGVLTGDQVLREIVQAMKSNLRSADVAARYGGEEFCVLLPQTTISEAGIIAERIRQSVEKIVFPLRQITVSIGVTSSSYGTQTAEEIIKAADEAMRKAKKKGKNKVQAGF
jgi:diguanylate cyclase (GGDEF)-like protein